MKDSEALISGQASPLMSAPRSPNDLQLTSNFRALGSVPVHCTGGGVGRSGDRISGPPWLIIRIDTREILRRRRRSSVTFPNSPSTKHRRRRRSIDGVDGKLRSSQLAVDGELRRRTTPSFSFRPICPVLSDGDCVHNPAFPSL
jgi:hypothetical protein